MRPPHPNTSSPPIPLRRMLLRQYFAQVLIRYQEVGHGDAVHHNVVVGGGVGLCVLNPFLLCRRSCLRWCLFGCLRSSRHWHEEVNLSALQLSIGWNNHDLGDDTVVIGRRWGGLLEDVLRVGLHDLAGPDCAADLFDFAITVYDSNHIQSSTWQNARDAAPDGVFHGCCFFLLISLSPKVSLIEREREEEEEEEEKKGRSREWKRMRKKSLFN